MVDRNDFKLLKQRCLRHFELAKGYLGDKKLDLDDIKKPDMVFISLLFKI